MYEVITIGGVPVRKHDSMGSVLDVQKLATREVIAAAIVGLALGVAIGAMRKKRR